MREFLLDFKEKLVRHSFAASLRERLPGEQSTSDPPGQRVDSSFVFLSAVSAVGVGFVADRFQTRHALLVSMLLVAGGAVAMLFIGPETDRRMLARHAFLHPRCSRPAGDRENAKAPCLRGGQRSCLMVISPIQRA